MQKHLPICNQILITFDSNLLFAKKTPFLKTNDGQLGEVQHPQSQKNHRIEYSAYKLFCTIIIVLSSNMLGRCLVRFTSYFCNVCWFTGRGKGPCPFPCLGLLRPGTDRPTARPAGRPAGWPACRIYIYSPNYDFNQGRGSYFLSIVIPLDSRIDGCQPTCLDLPRLA